MLSLRQRLIDEILDEDRNVNRQVFDREKVQAKIFTEAVKPKSERDLDAEYKTEQSIESIKSVLENKVNAVDFLVSGIPQLGTGLGLELNAIDKNISIIVKNGDFVSVYNNIVRNINRPDIRNDIKDTSRIKMAEIQPQINAIVFGIKNIIPPLLLNPPVRPNSSLDAILTKLTSIIPPVVGALSVYSIVQKQLNSNSFRLIDQSDINNEFNTISRVIESAGLPNAPNDLTDWAGIGDWRRRFNLIMLYHKGRTQAISDFTDIRRRAFDEERRREGIQFSLPNRDDIELNVRLNMPNASPQQIAREVDRRMENERIVRMNSAIPRLSNLVAPIDPSIQQQLLAQERAERAVIEPQRTTRVAPAPVVPVAPVAPVAPVVEGEEESPIPPLFEEEVEGEGKPKRKIKKVVGLRIKKPILQFDDSRNDMYDY
jgi:hypothetical protein